MRSRGSSARKCFPFSLAIAVLAALTHFPVKQSWMQAVQAARLRTRTYSRLSPELEAEVKKIENSEEHVRATMKKQEEALDKEKDHVNDIREQLHDAQGRVDKLETWLGKAEHSVEKLEAQKHGIHIRWDLQRLRPYIKSSTEKKRKLEEEQRKIGSAHDEVTNRVAALEDELKRLDFEGSSSRSYGSSSYSASTGGDNYKDGFSASGSEGTDSDREKNESLDDLLKDLDSK